MEYFLLHSIFLLRENFSEVVLKLDPGMIFNLPGTQGLIFTPSIRLFIHTQIIPVINETNIRYQSPSQSHVLPEVFLREKVLPVVIFPVLKEFPLSIELPGMLVWGNSWEVQLGLDAEGAHPRVQVLPQALGCLLGLNIN